MDYKVSGVSFVFENCDSVSFQSNQIGDCQIGGIHEVIKRVAMNAITDSDVADEIFIEVVAGANTQHIPFGIKSNLDLQRQTVFDRIKQNDITQVVLFYENGFELPLQVPFESEPVNDADSGCRNICQDTYVSESGLHVCISSTGKKAFDYVKENVSNGCCFLEQAELDLKNDDVTVVRPERMTDAQMNAYIDSIKESEVYQNLECMHDQGCDEQNMYQKFFSGILDLLRIHGYDPDWLRDVFEPKLAAVYDF